VSYAAMPVLDGINASLARGAMTAIIGPNGAGKSTLLKAALGLSPPQAARHWPLVKPVAKPCPASPMSRNARRWIGISRPGLIDVVLMGMYRRTGLLGRIGPA
jgi:manganese/zinc/iron transport system ATP- binding protein